MHMHCKTQSKQRREQCKRHAIPGATVCRMHGAKTPRGPDLPQFKSGRYSNFLPTRLAATYRNAAKDPELLSLHSEIALLDARMAELLGRVDTGESGALWGTLQKEWATCRRCTGPSPRLTY
jgi:hypothetical protein